MLKLRILTEKSLEEVGLSDYHFERVNNGRSLALVGKCGKPIYTVKGIEVSQRLTKDEREFLIRFLQNLLIENLDEIKRVIFINDRINELTDMANEYKGFSLQAYGAKKAYYQEGKATITYFPESHNFDYTFNAATTEEIKNFMRKEDDHLKKIKEYISLKERIKELNSELSKINSCNA